MNNMPEEGFRFTKMVQMEILSGEQSGRGTNIISVPEYTSNAVTESLHWRAKQDHQLTTKA